MLNWCRRTLRNWLREKADDDRLECLIRDRHDCNCPRKVLFNITGIQGLGLMGRSATDVRLLRSCEAVDRNRFWKIWKRLNTAAIAWEDGTPYDPSTDSE